MRNLLLLAGGIDALFHIASAGMTRARVFSRLTATLKATPWPGPAFGAFMAASARSPLAMRLGLGLWS